jgi:pectinesterase
MNRCFFYLSFFMVTNFMAIKEASAQKQLVVDAGGKGDFKTIQAAINSLPDSSATDRTVFVRKGIYHEKVSITKNHIVLQGENSGNTIITQSIAREIWLCSNPNDWGVATVNLTGNDITLKNLSILNTYGLDAQADSTVNCPNGKDSSTKTVRKTSHQMALRTMQTTRLKVINCILRAYGGDTVSPWNVISGMYYFKDCTMEGGVDFYCPRGWAYAENCTFICHSLEAAIWHDGSKNSSEKTVLKNCSFRGDAGFKLGRYHLDAQFYLINCTFAKEMADAPIFQAATSKGVQWGNRCYFYNCHRLGGDYSWLNNNLADAERAPSAQTITAGWTFDHHWEPLKTD